MINKKQQQNRIIPNKLLELDKKVSHLNEEIKKMLPDIVLDSLDYDYILDEVSKKIPEPKDGITPEVDYKKIIDEVTRQIKVPKDGDDAIIDYERIISEVKVFIPSPRDGKDGEKGKDIEPETLKEITEEVDRLKRLVNRVPIPASIRIRALINGVLQNSPLESINFGSGITVTSKGFDYTITASGGGGGLTQVYSETVSISGSTGTLANTPSGAIALFIGGGLATPITDYTISGATITLSAAMTTEVAQGAIVQANYQHS